MPQSKDPPAAARQPTPRADLNPAPPPLLQGDAARPDQPADPAEAAAAFDQPTSAQADKAARAREILERKLAEKRGRGGFLAGRPGGPPGSGGGRPGGGQFTPPPMRPGSRRGRG
jgi:hypothetical protein